MICLSSSTILLGRLAISRQTLKSAIDIELSWVLGLELLSLASDTKYLFKSAIETIKKMNTLLISVGHNEQFQNFNQFATNRRNYTSTFFSSRSFILPIHLYHETTTRKTGCRSAAGSETGNPSCSCSPVAGCAWPPSPCWRGAVRRRVWGEIDEEEAQTAAGASRSGTEESTAAGLLERELVVLRDRNERSERLFFLLQ